jgi:hypothetical protein
MYVSFVGKGMGVGLSCSFVLGVFLMCLIVCVWLCMQWQCCSVLFVAASRNYIPIMSRCSQSMRIFVSARVYSIVVVCVQPDIIFGALFCVV